MTAANPRAAAATVAGIGYVLPGLVGADVQVLSARPWSAWEPGDNAKLNDFSAKPYLQSVKGYLDPAGAFCLAAAALSLGPVGEERDTALQEGTGLCTITSYGSMLSGLRFYEQFVQKGPRLASPLVFPHSYSNTPGNLAAIEFGFAGPHMVLYGPQDVREGIQFALTRLARGDAEDMVVVAYEAAPPKSVPDGHHLMHGAVALRLTAASAANGGAAIDAGKLWAMPPPDMARGAAWAVLDVLAAAVA